MWKVNFLLKKARLLVLWEQNNWLILYENMSTDGKIPEESIKYFVNVCVCVYSLYTNIGIHLCSWNALWTWVDLYCILQRWHFHGRKTKMHSLCLVFGFSPVFASGYGSRTACLLTAWHDAFCCSCVTRLNEFVKANASVG